MIATISCYFNPLEWNSRSRNLVRFRKNYHGPDLYIVEASYTNNFIFEDSLHIQAEEKNKFIWQKERMLNHLVTQLPDKYEYIAWVDCDIIFKKENWQEPLIEAIESYGAVQLFEYVEFLNENNVVERRWPGTGLTNINKPVTYHPGFAWATKRSNFPLYEHSICGTGDLCMAEWWLHQFNTKNANFKSKGWRDHSEKESLRFAKMTNGKITCIEGDIIHLFHGTFIDRQYHLHSSEVGKRDYDPESDIIIGENGLFEWANNEPLQDYLKSYFQNRNEDYEFRI